MAIVASEPEGGNFPRILAPDGIQAAVCCDVVDRGLVESEWQGEKKTSHKVSIHFLLDEQIPSRWSHPHTNEVVMVPPELAGRPFGISRWFTLSLHEKSALRHFLKTWRGKDFTADQLKGFDLETLIGAPAAITIVHNYAESKDRYYANLEGISRLPKQWEAPTIPTDYVRIKDREQRDNGGNGRPAPAAQPAAANTYGRGPDADWDGEPIPSQDFGGGPEDDLPFMRMDPLF